MSAHWIFTILLIQFAGSSDSAAKCSIDNVLAMFKDNHYPKDHIREVVNIRGGNDRFSVTRLEGKHFSDYHFRTDNVGDHISISLSPRAKAALDVKSEPINLRTLAIEEKKELIRQYYASQKYKPQLIEEMMPTFLEKVDHDRYFVASVNAYANDPKINRGNLPAHRQEVPKPGITLSNRGSDRYFWFTPSGETEMVPARILDIHKHSDSDHYTLLAEYLGKIDAPDSEFAHRSRAVLEISDTELHTMSRDGSLFQAETARQHFLDSMTPAEIEVQKLAQEGNVNLYGFSDYRRRPEVVARQNTTINTPLLYMNNTSWLAMKGSIEEHFGRFDHLFLKPGASDVVNTIDAFSKLDPKYVLEKFYSTQFEYSWVITEDGLLKVVPKMEIDNNLKPQLLRLSGGRRIYAGGDFTINADGTLNVATRASGYHSRTDFSGAFANGNKGLDEFVNNVFRLQSEKKVRNFSKTVEDPFGFQAHSSYGFSNTMNAGNVNVSGMKWNRETESPITYRDWKEKTGISHPHQSQQIWAHYVLGTSPKMKFAEIKKIYRELSLKFHPDRNHGSEKSTETFKSIGEAWSFITKFQKSVVQ